MALNKILWLFILLSSSNSDANVPEPKKKTCRSTENICVSCEVMAICVNDGHGFRTHEQPCRENETCVKGECVQGALCNVGNFTCNQGGYFPDIEDCQVYHICLPDGEGLTKKTIHCNDSSYMVDRKACGGHLDTSACNTRPVPECEERGQLGALPGYSKYYYVCKEEDSSLTPMLYECPESHVFHKASKTCIYAMANRHHLGGAGSRVIYLP